MLTSLPAVPPLPLRPSAFSASVTEDEEGACVLEVEVEVDATAKEEEEEVVRLSMSLMPFIAEPAHPSAREKE